MTLSNYLYLSTWNCLESGGESCSIENIMLSNIRPLNITALWAKPTFPSSRFLASLPKEPNCTTDHQWVKCPGLHGSPPNVLVVNRLEWVQQDSQNLGQQPRTWEPPRTCTFDNMMKSYLLFASQPLLQDSLIQPEHSLLPATTYRERSTSAWSSNGWQSPLNNVTSLAIKILVSS